MTASTFFLMVPVVLIAPHLDWPTARSVSLACIGLSLLFWFLEPPR